MTEVHDISLHIKIGDFEYVELSLSGDTSPEQVKEYYTQYSKPFTVGAGLSEKEFNSFVDNLLLSNGENHIESMEQLNDYQTYAMQVIKRGIKRLEAKQNKV